MRIKKLDKPYKDVWGNVTVKRRQYFLKKAKMPITMSVLRWDEIPPPDRKRIKAVIKNCFLNPQHI
jgi:hypothetical protein